MTSVALLDHYSAGHHVAFIKLFTKYFLKLGHRVYLFFPNQEQEIRIYLKAEAIDDSQLFFSDFQIQKKKVSGLGRFNHAAATLLFWLDTRKALKQAQRKWKVKFDFVFLAWLDDYLANYLHHSWIDFLFPYQFSGLYFHPWYLNSPTITTRVSFSSVDSVLRSKNCISVALHDEFNINTLKQRLRKKVLLFPEIADSTAPNADLPLANQIAKLAKGRMVVGVIGISHRKGFPTFIDVIQQANPNDFFFFFSGRFNETEFEENELKAIRTFLNELPSHCLYFPDYIQEGANMNAVLQAIDVFYLVYNNFQSSSNLITKAAIFHKLVLSGNRFWMGRVTNQYTLGITVPEEDSTQSLTALNAFRLDKKKYESACQWVSYFQVHQESNLELSLKNCLQPE